jgi:hypothetical protein
MMRVMDGRRIELFGGGSSTPPSQSITEPMPRHPGLDGEPSSPEGEPQAQVSDPEPVVAHDARPASPDPETAVQASASMPTAGGGVGIGELHYVEPQVLWPGGEGELLAWLAANPEPLAVVTGLSLRPATDGRPQAESSLVLETDDGDPVVVVLDLGESSDNSLGRLMRMVAATEAKAAIWAAATARPEHLASMSWLNRMVAEKSFIVQLRGVRIDDSRPAPILGPMLRPARRDDKPPADAPAEVGTPPNYGRRADDWPAVSLIEREVAEPD